MEQPLTTSRPLLPQQPLQDVMSSEFPPDRPEMSKDPELPKKARLRRPKEAAKTHEEWEAIKEPFREHYVERGFRLEDAMAWLEESHGFKAS